MVLLVTVADLSGCRVREPLGPLSPPDPTLDDPIGIETQEATALELRLEALAKRLDESRAEHHVPGLAIAVVKDDALVLARGFGKANLEDGTPVTPQTLFSIGSSTKAFTATLAGAVAAEGRLDLDDPLERHVPELVLPVDAKEKDAKATIRDALCHRTGFTRMSLLWIAGDVPRRDVFAQASKAEPWAKYRERFLYNNVLYAAAGDAAARASKSTYTELLVAKILGPLGMSDTSLDFERVRDDGRRAQGYAWLADESTLEPVPPRDITQMAPAGGIYSNVLDMSRWLRLQLAKGTFEGRVIVPRSVIEETWTPQFQIAPGNAYGLGWFLEQWRGKQVVFHGGNIDGYAAMVALVPEERVGFVMLANVGATPLQNAARSMVWEAVLGDGPIMGGGGDASEDLTAYLGPYVANFGPFKKVVFAVTEKNGKLHVDVPGQTNYEVDPPGKDGRRPFAITETIAVSFEDIADGKARVMRLHQGGLDFELLREGHVPEPEIPVADLAKYVGEYTSGDLGVATVLVQHNRLAVDIPKQMVYELQVPNEQGRWRFRIKPDIAIEFPEVTDKGATKMVLHQDGKTVEFRRTGGPSKAAKLPTVASLQKLRGVAKNGKALDKVGVVEIVGRVRFLQAGIEGQLRIIADAERAVVAMDLGRFGRLREVILAEQAWSAHSFSPTRAHHGKMLAQARASHPLTYVLDWTHAFDEVTVDGFGVSKGRDVLELSMKKGDLPPYAVSVATDTGEVVRVQSPVIVDGAGTIEQTIELSDHRRALGMSVPHHVEVATDANGRIVWTIDTVRKFTGDPAAVFVAP